MFVSAAVYAHAATSPSLAIVVGIHEGWFKIAWSIQLATEVFEKLRRKGVPASTAEKMIARLGDLAGDSYDVETHSKAEGRVHKDDVFLVALAVVAGSWCIVSHDNDLTVDWGDGPPPAWKPPTFLQHLRERLARASTPTSPGNARP